MKTYGARAFATSASELWNQLPDDIRSSDNLTTFKSKLKTYNFKYGFKNYLFYIFYDRVKCIELCICATQVFYIIFNTCSTRRVMGIWRSCQTRLKCKILPSIINLSSFLTWTRWMLGGFVSSRTIWLKSITRKRLEMNYPRCM